MSQHPVSARRSEARSRIDHQDDLLQDSNRSLGERHLVESEDMDEATPLLSRNEPPEPESAAQHASRPPSPSSSLAEERSPKKGLLRRRWPTVIALSVLSLAMLLVIAFGFAAPAVVEEYVEQAAVFKPTNLSIDSFTSKGINARVQGDFYMDSSKVQKQAVRDLGRAALWIAAAVEVRPLEVEAILPEYGDVLLASANVPNIILATRDGTVTHVDFVASLESGDLEAIRRIADDWIQGNLRSLRVEGRSKVALKSGIFSLGTKEVSQDMVLEESMLPSTPKYDIKKLNVHEITDPSLPGGLYADVDIAIFNRYPLMFTVPPLNFNILVHGCPTDTNNILVANASTQAIQVRPKATVSVAAQATIHQLPDTLISTCPDSQSSPLDALLSRYMHGAEATLLIQGSPSPTGATPQWLSELMASVVVPIPITGHSFENFIEDFSMTDVHFSMPNPLSDPTSPQANPRISATVRVQAKLPQEINFSVDVPHVRATADVFFKGNKLGQLDLHQWQNASSQVDVHEKAHPKIIIMSAIEEAPLNVTDKTVLSEVVREMFFGHGDVMLDVRASVDAEISTVLGTIVARGIPAAGRVPIPLSDRNFTELNLQTGGLDIVKTTESSLSMEAKVNFSNPTKYSASIPYANVNLSWRNRTLLGHATIRDVEIRPGKNQNIRVRALWDPLRFSGHDGVKQSSELLSRYVSGYNTTLTLTTHSGSIPSCPGLGKALATFPLDIAAPSLSFPHDPNRPDNSPDGDGPHFIDDATMHLLSSTATFTLLNPIGATIFLTHINATALYNHTEPVGQVLYELPLAVPPGATTSPRLPVDWSLTGIGFNAVKDALGGTLKLDTVAHVGVRVGKWEGRIWYRGSGIGAHITL